MIEWVAIATALAAAAQTVGGELVKEGLKSSLKPASEQFNANFLRGYKAKQHENNLRRALEATETAFRATPSLTTAQADAVLTRVTQLARNPRLQKQTLALLLTFRRSKPLAHPRRFLARVRSHRRTASRACRVSLRTPFAFRADQTVRAVDAIRA
ncbi:MAG: hypothetical protein HY868_16485 [Chloroflexi bacterium]|nr:hypothetical protein [Chloroflexota bacterium]